VVVLYFILKKISARELCDLLLLFVEGNITLALAGQPMSIIQQAGSQLHANLKNQGDKGQTKDQY
jgi:hypothetical protein